MVRVYLVYYQHGSHFSHASDSRIANVRPSVCPLPKHLSLSESLILTIVPLNCSIKKWPSSLKMLMELFLMTFRIPHFLAWLYALLHLWLLQFASLTLVCFPCFQCIRLYLILKVWMLSKNFGKSNFTNVNKNKQNIITIVRSKMEDMSRKSNEGFCRQL